MRRLIVVATGLVLTLVGTARLAPVAAQATTPEPLLLTGGVVNATELAVTDPPSSISGITEPPRTTMPSQQPTIPMTTIIDDPPVTPGPTSGTVSSPVSQYGAGITADTVPDPQIATGLAHFVLGVNFQLAVLNKTEPRDPLYFSLDSIFNTPSDEYAFDPRLIYDSLADRFIAVAVAHDLEEGADGQKDGYVKLAMSLTTNPRGVWCYASWTVKWLVATAVNDFTDRPFVGVDNEGIYITFASGHWPYDTAAPQTGNLISVVKSSFMDCGSVAYYSYKDLKDKTGARVTHMVPAVSLDTTGYEYFVSQPVGGGTHIDFKRQSTPSAALQTLDRIDVPDFSWGGLSEHRRSPNNSTADIESGAGTILENAFYYAGKLLTSATTRSQLFAENNAVRVYDIGISNAAPTGVTTTEFSDANRDYYAPALAHTTGGRTVVSFNFSSPLDYVGIMYAERLNGSWRVPRTLISGAESTVHDRIGDYAGASFDPASSGKVWFVNEYGTSGLSHRTYWGVVP